MMSNIEIKDIIWHTLNDVVVERCGREGTIVFDTATSLYKDFKAIKHEKIQRIEPDRWRQKVLTHLHISRNSLLIEVVA